MCVRRDQCFHLIRCCAGLQALTFHPFEGIDKLPLVLDTGGHAVWLLDVFLSFHHLSGTDLGLNRGFQNRVILG